MRYWPTTQRSESKKEEVKKNGGVGVMFLYNREMKAQKSQVLHCLWYSWKSGMKPVFIFARLVVKGQRAIFLFSVPRFLICTCVPSLFYPSKCLPFFRLSQRYNNIQKSEQVASVCSLSLSLCSVFRENVVIAVVQYYFLVQVPLSPESHFQVSEAVCYRGCSVSTFVLITS